jgi:hypothetical protein
MIPTRGFHSLRSAGAAALGYVIDAWAPVATAYTELAA